MKRITFILLSVCLGILSLSVLKVVLSQDQGPILPDSDGAVVYTIIDIGTLGGNTSEAAAINDVGQVVGWSDSTGDEAENAFLWQDGTLTPLSHPNARSSKALAINNAGTVAGTVVSGTAEVSIQIPLLWDEGKAIPLPVPGSAPGTASAINNQGHIAGNTLPAVDNSLLLWVGAQLSQTIPVSSGVVHGMNDLDQLVGETEEAQGLNSAFLWQESEFTFLGTLGGSSSTANAVNEAVQIVGTAAITGDLSSHAFLWQDGVMQELEGLSQAPAAFSEANSINNLGLIVGRAQSGDEEHAVMWWEGKILDLNTLLPADTPWDLLVSAEGINDQGWIVGTGLIKGHKRAFLLKPLLDKSLLPVVVVGKIPTPTPTATPTATSTPTATPSPTPIPSGVLDMNDFLIGNGVLYEVWQSKNNSQARFQTQVEGFRFYHTKGDEIRAEWEQLWSQNSIIYRGTDTSPGTDPATGAELYYTLYASKGSGPGSAWSPRYWKVGDVYERHPYVVFFRKSDCHPLYDDNPVNYLRFAAYHKSYTFASGITLKNVIELDWLQTPSGPFLEKYFYAQGYGLVGWRSSQGWYSNVSEIHPPGQRPDNTREVISCMDTLNRPFVPDHDLPPVPEELLRRIK